MLIPFDDTLLPRSIEKKRDKITVLKQRLIHFQDILDPGSLVRLKNSAEQAQVLEQQWIEKLKKFFEQVDQTVYASLTETGRVPVLDFGKFFTTHSFQVMKVAIQVAGSSEQNQGLPHRVPQKRSLASSPPNPKFPRNLADLRRLWDLYRKKKYTPRRQDFLAERIKKEYIKKVQKVWKEHSEAFRSGDEFTQQEARREMRKQAETSYSRAKMIVQTETTYYYNQTRKEIYDRSPDVTHYLFVPIRDSATTKWCRTRIGLVYEKESDVWEKEVPPCHWNCRSEFLPLTPSNPKHLVIINDKSRQRSKRSPEPLPPGWGRSARERESSKQRRKKT